MLKANMNERVILNILLAQDKACRVSFQVNRIKPMNYAGRFLDCNPEGFEHGRFFFFFCSTQIPMDTSDVHVVA